MMYNNMMVKIIPPAVKKIPLLKRDERRGNIQNAEIAKNITDMPNSTVNQ